MKKFYWADPPAQTAFPIAKTGYPLIIAFGFITFILALLEFSFLTIISLVFTLFTCYFFRDPNRITPAEKGAVISPADGKVIFAERVETNRFIEGPCLKISIFMSVFNVHVNRIPYEGTVKNVKYHPGKFFSANLDKASESNERNAVIIGLEDEKEMCVVQIAGLIARRIICGLQKDDKVIRGARFGMICFGSRLDVYLPVDSSLRVKVGDKVMAGTSILGNLV
ncbi:Phosphatidylserine decarboxylase proenzyme [Candidatus Magnetomoraceae bacterium gMMP-15]